MIWHIWLILLVDKREWQLNLNRKQLLRVIGHSYRSAFVAVRGRFIEIINRYQNHCHCRY